MSDLAQDGVIIEGIIILRNINIIISRCDHVIDDIDASDLFASKQHS